jgi:hypothetical protein
MDAVQNTLPSFSVSPPPPPHTQTGFKWQGQQRILHYPSLLTNEIYILDFTQSNNFREKTYNFFVFVLIEQGSYIFRFSDIAVLSKLYRKIWY